MPEPALDEELLDALALVYARAALDRLMREQSSTKEESAARIPTSGGAREKNTSRKARRHQQEARR